MFLPNDGILGLPILGFRVYKYDILDDSPTQSDHTDNDDSDDVDVDDKLVDVRWYFGSTTLPERVDAEHGAWELQVAVDAGIQPLAPTTVVAPASYDDLRDLADVAEARFRRCRADAEPPPAPNTF